MQTAYIYMDDAVCTITVVALNIACITLIGGMNVTGKRTIFPITTRAGRAAMAVALDQIRCFGALLRDAAAIAFTMRCKVIDGR